jgi:hypothetical protein
MGHLLDVGGRRGAGLFRMTDRHGRDRHDATGDVQRAWWLARLPAGSTSCIDEASGHREYRRFGQNTGCRRTGPARFAFRDIFMPQQDP